MTVKVGLICPKCSAKIQKYRNPLPTVDIIIQTEKGIVLIKRKTPPYGWALPGGFIDYDESAEDAAKREAKEETSLDVTELKLFNVYSDPERDPRHHTISVVFTAKAIGDKAAPQDDAIELGFFEQGNLPSPLAFDHAKILADFFGFLDKEASNAL
jgi:ADP-ribose pyrophosphatase YjhB (NUDIX family)